MRFGFDFDGTITKNPFLFKIIIDALYKEGHEIFIISGTSISDLNLLQKELKSFDIDLNYISKFLLKEKVDDIVNTTKWKYKIIDEYKIRCYFDNRPETVLVINELCTTLKVL